MQSFVPNSSAGPPRRPICRDPLLRVLYRSSNLSNLRKPSFAQAHSRPPQLLRLSGLHLQPTSTPFSRSREPPDLRPTKPFSRRRLTLSPTPVPARQGRRDPGLAGIPRRIGVGPRRRVCVCLPSRCRRHSRRRHHFPVRTCCDCPRHEAFQTFQSVVVPLARCSLSRCCREKKMWCCVCVVGGRVGSLAMHGEMGIRLANVFTSKALGCCLAPRNPALLNDLVLSHFSCRPLSMDSVGGAPGREARRREQDQSRRQGKVPAGGAAGRRS